MSQRNESVIAPRSRWRRTPILAVAMAATAALIVLAVLNWRSRRPAPPSAADDPVAIAKFAATADFAQMSMEQKAQLLQTLRTEMPTLVEAAKNGRLTREEQATAVRNGVKAGAQVEMRKFFALSAGPARRAHLDKLIDEQEQLRAYAAQARDGGPLQFGGAELKQFAESLPPEERIQMAQFGLEMFKRRAERGLPLWPYGN